MSAKHQLNHQLNNRLNSRLNHLIEAYLLMLSKPSLWLEMLTEMSQPAKLTPIVMKMLPVVAALIGAIAFWQWNAALMVALLTSTGMSMGLYRLLQQPHQPWQTLQQWIRHPKAPLVLTVGSGFALLLLTYGALSVWQAFNSPWLAALLLTQELGILAVLGLAIALMLSKQSVSPQLSSPHSASSPPANLYSFDRCVAGLLQRDDLRRLVAVRQLAILATRQELNEQEQAIASDYLLLLSRKEKDPVVRRAIQESLAVLAPTQRAARVPNPLKALPAASRSLTLQPLKQVSPDLVSDRSR